MNNFKNIYINIDYIIKINKIFFHLLKTIFQNTNNFIKIKKIYKRIINFKK